MKKMNSKKGFTLIELLIVIAIIAVLAVAFLPTLLGAPAKGRDTARIASLQKLQKVLVNANLEGHSYPDTTGCLTTAATNVLKVGATDETAYYLKSLGGTMPQDPSKTRSFTGAANTASGCAATGQYYYVSKPSTSYAFGLYAVLEKQEATNAQCTAALTGTITATVAATADSELCYAILTQ